VTVHLFRGLAKSFRRAQPKPDPVRYTRGVVVSSLIGQSTVILDDNGVQVPAFNMAHTQSLPSGTVVRVMVIGKQIEILGSYPS
jgi:hypothetical protein